MTKASRPAVKTLTLIKSRDLVVDRMLKPCEQDNHSKCTGWAVLRKEVSPIDANYFLKCTCTCHRQKKEQKKIKRLHLKIGKKHLRKRTKKKAKKKQKSIKSRRKSKRAKRR